MDSSQTRSLATPMMSITKDNDDGDDDDDDDDGDDDDDDDDHQTSANITDMTWLSSGQPDDDYSSDNELHQIKDNKENEFL